MPAPKPTTTDTGGGFTVSWTEIIASWDTIVADLYAVYGTAADAVDGWLDMRRLILGLMGRKESVFATMKVSEYWEQMEAEKKG